MIMRYLTALTLITAVVVTFDYMFLQAMTLVLLGGK